MATTMQREFAKKVYAAAKEATDISHIFVTAQAILETGWGHSRVGRFNLFGITSGSNWAGKTALVKTHEFLSRPDVKFQEPEKVLSVCKIKTGQYYYTVLRLFKDFDSLQDCLKEHSRLLQKPGYADAWPYRHDPEQFAHRICNNVGCKYATSPVYQQRLLYLINTVRKICL